MPVRPFLRLSWLTLRARLRSAGYVPWLLMIGWLLISASQEPKFLRRYGLFLFEDAQWSGCVVMLMLLLHVEPRLVRPRAWGANLLVVFGLAALITIVGLFELRSYDFSLNRCLNAGLSFTLVWGPVATLVATARQPSWHMGVQMLVVLFAVILGSIQAATLRAESLPVVFLSSAFSWSAALASIAISTISTYKK